MGIRFKEDKGEIATLRAKEAGDWKKLTLEEKKALYRASFCQTLAEVEAPNGEWKSIVGCVMVAVSVGIWGYFWMKNVVYGPCPTPSPSRASPRHTTTRRASGSKSTTHHL